MTAREFLDQYREADRRARRLKREYEKEQELIDSVRSSADIDGMPRGKNISKRVEDRAIRLADKALKLNKARLDAIEIRQRVFDVIQKIEGDAGEVLYLRYIELMQWTEIQERLNYSKNGIHKLHRKALGIVDQKRGY